MNSGRWRRLQEILAAALERPVKEREAFLDERCGDDQELRRELDSLLASSEEADAYFEDLAARAGLGEGDASEGAASGGGTGGGVAGGSGAGRGSTGGGDGAEDAGSQPAAASLVGRTIGHFRVDGVLGRGGMGEVYRATDTRLHREVALKVLPAAIGVDPAREARFRREALVLASLNHPNIASIHGLEEVDDRKVLVLELVEGATLAERLQAGPLPRDEAFEIGRQVAEALESAHEMGIVHRDLKPGNVKITPSGSVKVLDFGIAKAIRPALGGPGAADRTGESVAGPGAEATEAGQILGTAAYMSPEQARGRLVDRRSDVWSFGVLLFEMLTGQRAFPGDSTAEVLVRVLEREPDWSALPDDVPGPVRRLLERCLTRERRQRLQAIGEARIVLEAGGAAGIGGRLEGAGDHRDESSAPAGRRLARAGLVAGAGLLFLLGLLAGAGGLRLLQLEPAGDEAFRKLRLSVGMRPYEVRLSPDGETISFHDWSEHVWVLPLAEGEPRRLEGTERSLRPFWSWDGREIGFVRDRRVWKVPIDGGRPEIVGELPAGSFYGASWTEDGFIVLSTTGGLFRLASAGGDPELFFPRDPEAVPPYHDPAVLPNGDVLFADIRGGRILALRQGATRTVLEIAGGEVREPDYSASGHLVFLRMDGPEGAWAAPYSARRAELTGEPFLVRSGAEAPSVSRDGQMVYYVEPPRRQQMVWVDRRGEILERLGRVVPVLEWPAISPDGTRAAVMTLDNDRRGISILDLRTGALVSLTDPDRRDHALPFWSPDGRRVGYHFLDRETYSIHLVPVDGGSEVEVVEDASQGEFSPDGRHLVYTRVTETRGRDIWIRSAAGGDDRPLMETDRSEGLPRVSPGGDLMAFIWGRAGFPHVYVRGFPDGGGPWPISPDEGRNPVWASSGEELFYWEELRLMSVAVDRLDGVPRFGRPELVFSVDERNLVPEQFDVAPDGARFLMVESLEPPPSESPATIFLVQGWAREFDGR